MSIMRPLAGLTVPYRIVSVAVIVGTRGVNELPVYKVCLWIVSCTPRKSQTADSPIFRFDTGTVFLDWQERTCEMWKNG